MGADPVILAVDPGRGKCGVALMTSSSILDRRVIPAAGLVPHVKAVLRDYPRVTVIIGNRTSSRAVQMSLRRDLPDLTLTPVDESGTTLEARRLYFADHPPRGWRRLLPPSLQVPSTPYDDYAAIALGRRFLASRRAPP